MLVLDSNVWVYAVTAKKRPVEIYTESHGIVRIFEDILTGNHRTAITPYIATEVEDACRRSNRVSGPDIDDAITRFYAIAQQCSHIRTEFTQADLERLDLDSCRDSSHNQLLGRVLDIQPKDVPILLLAYDSYFLEPTILTDDSDFSGLTPADFGLVKIAIEELNLSW